jgi:arsenate reductase-like glutaredoxin family protein
LAAQAGGVKAIFSWKSPSARPLALDPAGADEEQLLGLMEREPRLIRRPIVLVGDQPVVGGDAKELARLLG